MNSSNTKTKEEKKLIPYKYEDAKNKEYKDKILNLSDSDSDRLIKVNDSKSSNKYENLSEEELLNLIQEKNDKLIKLSDEKDKTKNKLNKIIKKLNNAISNNADILCKEETDPETLEGLEKVFESKKKMLKISKNMNINFKNHYNSMINKIPGNNIGKEGKINQAETQLIELINENKNLELEIRKYKDDGISKRKEIEIICEDKIYPAKIKMKSEDFRSSVNQKIELTKKINMSMNSLKNLIKEVEYLERIYDEKDNKKTIEENDNIENKIQFWIDIIKSDLTGTENDIISRIEKNESKFINEIDKKIINNKNGMSNKVRSSSPILNEKVFLNHSINKMKEINNLELDDINSTYNGKQIINKVMNSNILYPQITEKNLYKSKNINPPKGVFAKFSYLKQKPSTSEKRYITINTEEKSPEKIIDNIIQKDYNDTTDADYRELLEKKSQYFETNSRLGENLKKIQKTLNKKINTIEIAMQENTNKLSIIKSRNELLEKEVENLNKVYQLTLEQEKIKYELKQKEDKIGKEIEQENKKQNTIINQLDNSSYTENTILNALKETNEIPKKTKKNKNNSGYVDTNTKDTETREEKLQKIKEKYMNMNDDCIDESDLME